MCHFSKLSINLHIDRCIHICLCFKVWSFFCLCVSFSILCRCMSVYSFLYLSSLMWVLIGLSFLSICLLLCAHIWVCLFLFRYWFLFLFVSFYFGFFCVSKHFGFLYEGISITLCICLYVGTYMFFCISLSRCVSLHSTICECSF